MPTTVLISDNAGTMSFGDNQDYSLSEALGAFVSDTFGWSFGANSNNNMIVGGALIASSPGITDASRANGNSVTIVSTGSKSASSGVRLDNGNDQSVFNNDDITGFKSLESV